MKLFNNPKPVVIAIVAFVLLMFSYWAFADQGDIEAEFGPTFTGEFNGGTALLVNYRVFDNVDAGFGLISSQEWDDVSIGNNGVYYLNLIAEKPAGWWRVLPDEMGLGPSGWIKEQAPINGCHLGFNMALKWRFGDFGVGVRHWSNAGTCKPNRGQDVLTFSYRF